MDLTGLGSVFDFAGKVLERVIPDPTQRAAAQVELAKLQQTGDLAKLTAETDLLKGQIEINKVEAASPNWLIAGARPFILWTCGFGLAYVSIIEPLARFIATVICHYSGPFPAIDTNLTMQVLLGLLGLSGMRTYEKKTNTEKNR